VESGFRSILLVYIYSVLGVFLVIAPWTPVWEQASHGLLPQAAHVLALSGWVRGLVSGLGAADLVVAARLAGRMMRAAGK
jgi:hypothetical protein